MFDLQLTLGEKVIRALVIYLFLVIALRVVGKRELTQLNTLDFVVLLAVANAVQNGLIGADNSVTGAVAGATVLFLLASGLGWLLYRSGLLRRALEGTPTELIRDGEVLDDALRREEIPATTCSWRSSPPVPRQSTTCAPPRCCRAAR